MVESSASEIDDVLMLQAFSFAAEIIREICEAQLDFVASYKKTHELPVITLTCKVLDETLKNQVYDLVTEERVQRLFNTGKEEFHAQLHALEEVVLADL